MGRRSAVKVRVENQLVRFTAPQPFEAEEVIEQCKVCHSQGHLLENKHYNQTWSDGVSDEITSYYWGPPLDPESFKNYKIYPE